MIDGDDLDRQAEREHRIERDDHREPRTSRPRRSRRALAELLAGVPNPPTKSVKP